MLSGQLSASRSAPSLQFVWFTPDGVPFAPNTNLKVSSNLSMKSTDPLGRGVQMPSTTVLRHRNECATCDSGCYAIASISFQFIIVTAKMESTYTGLDFPCFGHNDFCTCFRYQILLPWSRCRGCFFVGHFPACWILALDPTRNPWQDMHFLATAVHGAKSCGLDEVHFGMPGCP